MKKKILFFYFALFFVFPLLAQSQEESFEGRQEDSEMEALRQWLREKRLVTIKEIGGDLSLSGEVRAELQAMNEKKNGIKQRGEGGATSKPAYGLDVEVNIMLDYRSERTWASVKLEYDNDMGTETGTMGKLNLEKAFFGGRVVAGDTFTMDIEAGRRNLGNVFDSKIEFSSLFDGVLFRFNKAFESIGEFYVNTGAFLINDRLKHFGYVGEMGCLKIGNTGFYLKYSLVDWKKHTDNYLRDLRYNFIVSQMILGYQCTPQNWQKLLKFYIAALCNHVAKKLPLTLNRKLNWGGYAGVSVGKVLKKGDWALDTNFQYVQLQALPDFDSNGIKRGNAAAVGTYTTNLDGTGVATTNANAVGSENFMGPQAELLYAITNNLTMLMNFAFSTNASKHMGPRMHYKQFEIEFIYAF